MIKYIINFLFKKTKERKFTKRVVTLSLLIFFITAIIAYHLCDCCQIIDNRNITSTHCSSIGRCKSASFSNACCCVGNESLIQLFFNESVKTNLIHKHCIACNITVITYSLQVYGNNNSIICYHYYKHASSISSLFTKALRIHLSSFLI